MANWDSNRSLPVLSRHFTIPRDPLLRACKLNHFVNVSYILVRVKFVLIVLLICIVVSAASMSVFSGKASTIVVSRRV